jgi:hypothetical protein
VAFSSHPPRSTDSTPVLSASLCVALNTFSLLPLLFPCPPLRLAGMPIDPPLRSRMVARYVESIGADPDLANWLPEPLKDVAVWQRVCAFAAAIRQHQFATAALDHDTLPLESMIHLALAIESGLDSASVLARILPRDVARSEAVRIATASFLLKPTTTTKLSSPSPPPPPTHRMVSTPAFDTALQQMLRRPSVRPRSCSWSARRPKRRSCRRSRSISGCRSTRCTRTTP